MEKKQKKKYGYSAISIKADVAVRFRRYSRQFSKSNTEVLHRMMFFLQWNGLDPFGNTIEKIVKAIEKNRKQVEYMISILKNMEKLHIKPTHEMVKILFEAHCKNKEVTEKEKLFLPEPITKEEEEDETVPKIFHERLQIDFKEYRENCKSILKNVEIIEPRFGKPYLKINMSIGEYRGTKYLLDKD